MGCSSSNSTAEDNTNKYENFDWDGLLEKLPAKKTEEDKNIRNELWKKKLHGGIDGCVTLEMVKNVMIGYLDLPNEIIQRDPLKMAFDAAKDKCKNKEDRKEGLQKDEFRIFFVYLRQYFEYWIMFERLDSSGDHKITLEEFTNAIPTMKNWGVEIFDPKSEFAAIDVYNTGSISFDEFCHFAIQKALDLEDDDNFDDSALKDLE